MAAEQDEPQRVIGRVAGQHVAMAVVIALGLVSCTLLGLGVQVLLVALALSWHSLTGVG